MARLRACSGARNTVSRLERRLSAALHDNECLPGQRGGLERTLLLSGFLLYIFGASWTADALGNYATQQRLGSGTGRDFTGVNTFTHSVELTTSVHTRAAGNIDTTTSSYSSGLLLTNVVKTDLGVIGTSPHWFTIDSSTNLYSSDNRLRLSALKRDTLYPDLTTDVLRYAQFEEYRYDALGRRVWTRMQRGWNCYRVAYETGCVSAVTRTVWDGDQLLEEVRAPADTASTTAALWESDAFGGDYQAQFGTVTYVHGAGLDRPLTLVRRVYGTGEVDVVPHADWRGELDGGTCLTNTLACTQIPWPVPGMSVAFDAPAPPQQYGLPPQWFGSLPIGKADGSGYLYMRNRYYDPKSGRFTQSDPIGLAGGLNAYGFASGDPVNYSDPFGLCPCSEDDFQQFVAGVAQRTAPLKQFVENDVGEVTGVNNLGRGLDNLVAGNVAAGTVEIALAIPVTEEANAGFASFKAFKRAMGTAGEGMQWHHIVGQGGNVERFGAEAIHSSGNLVRIPTEIHARISAFYSTKLPGLGMTVRKWLRTQSLQEQYKFGMQVLKSFGIVK